MKYNCTPSFSQFLNDDFDTFFDAEVFGEKMLIDGQEITVVKDDDKLAEFNSRLSEELAEGELLFYAKISDFAEELFVGKEIVYRNSYYLISSVSENEGLYTVVLVGNQS